MTGDQALPFEPGKPYCHNCGADAPAGTPGPHDRCAECQAHLHHCRNCMFRTFSGCLLRMSYRFPSTGLPGQDCPRFVWRDDEVADELASGAETPTRP